MLSGLRATLTTVINTATAEDDTSIPTEVKLPILQDFYRHIYNPDWHFSCMYEISPNNTSLLVLCYHVVSC
jgi:farnesyl-diphosphate farnesyltransferase